jgi:hypothetical protein
MTQSLLNVCEFRACCAVGVACYRKWPCGEEEEGMILRPMTQRSEREMK